MKLVIIGYSNVFKNRIIPVIDKLNLLDSVCIAKYHEQCWDDAYKSIQKPVTLYNDYLSAINYCNADIAYISSTNQSHFYLAQKTLLAGFHTIVDKPITLTFKESEQLIRLARDSGLLLSESTVYTYHPQMTTVMELLKKEKAAPKLITSLFSFPPMDKNNFRYNEKLGGGALLDTGPYVASVGRFFFGERPLDCYYIENNHLKSGLETSYSLLLKYPKGRALIGHFGFTTEYINRINVLAENICIDIDRIFTIPEIVENTIKVRINNRYFELKAPPGNMFEMYFIEIEKYLSINDFEKMYSNILFDAWSRDLIQKRKEYGNKSMGLSC